MVNMAGHGRGRPNPSVLRTASELPASLKNEAHAGSEIQLATGRSRFTVRDEKGSVRAVLPSDVLPTQAVALVRTKSSVGENGRNRLQRFRGRFEMLRFIVQSDHSFTMAFARKQRDRGSSLQHSPLLSEPQGATQ